MAHVTAPLVIAKLANGSDVYLYQGAPVPDGLGDGELDRLVEGGFAADDEDKPKAPAKPAAK